MGVSLQVSFEWLVVYFGTDVGVKCQLRRLLAVLKC